MTTTGCPIPIPMITLWNDAYETQLNILFHPSKFNLIGSLRDLSSLCRLSLPPPGLLLLLLPPLPLLGRLSDDPALLLLVAVLLARPVLPASLGLPVEGVLVDGLEVLRVNSIGFQQSKGNYAYCRASHTCILRNSEGSSIKLVLNKMY